VIVSSGEVSANNVRGHDETAAQQIALRFTSDQRPTACSGSKTTVLSSVASRRLSVASQDQLPAAMSRCPNGSARQHNRHRYRGPSMEHQPATQGDVIEPARRRGFPACHCQAARQSFSTAVSTSLKSLAVGCVFDVARGITDQHPSPNASQP